MACTEPVNRRTRVTLSTVLCTSCGCRWLHGNTNTDNVDDDDDDDVHNYVNDDDDVYMMTAMMIMVVRRV